MSARSSKSPWYRAARRAQERWKTISSVLPDAARLPGVCWQDVGRERVERGPSRICLPADYACDNLVASIRAEAVARFARHDIDWHMWTPGPDGTKWPSTHLLDSQVQCVNVLLSLAATDGLLALVRSADPQALRLVDVEDGTPIAFEWIGARDYLGESRGRPRRRGRFATSADAIAIAERSGGGRTLVLIEWKFTEQYPDPVAFRGQQHDRRDTYRRAYEAPESPFAVRPPIESFFHEPHYQLLRQALLADAMVGAREFGVDRAVLLHIVPSANRTLLEHVPDGLRTCGDDLESAWRALLPGPTVRYECADSFSVLTSTPELEERYGSLMPESARPEA